MGIIKSHFELGIIKSHQNWAELGKKFIEHDNLFAMIDYFWTENVSSADAEKGFSVLMGTNKTQNKKP